MLAININCPVPYKGVKVWFLLICNTLTNIFDHPKWFLDITLPSNIFYMAPYYHLF